MRKSNRIRSQLRLVMIVAVVCLVPWFGRLSTPVFAQSANDAWSRPISIVESAGRVTTGAIASDSLGNIHLLITNTPDISAPIGIEYLYWNGAEWSSPVSIIMDADGADTLMPQLAIDGSDYLHVVWISNSTVYYSRASSIAAGSARSWSKPLALGKTYLTPIDIVSGPNSDLYVAFSDASLPGQVSLYTSTDGGDTWSSPIVVAETPWETVPGDVQLALDESGRLHASWTVYSLAQGNQSQGVYYAHSQPGEISLWSAATQVAGPRHGQAGIGTVGENEVHLAWRSNVGGDGTFHQWSNDGGTTWFPRDERSDGGGFSGLAYFVADSLNHVHYIYGAGQYDMWNGKTLPELVDVVTPDVRDSAIDSNGEFAALTIGKGNRLHVVFETDFNQVWYTSKLLDVPEAVHPAEEAVRLSLDELSLPTRVPSSVGSATPQSQPTPSPNDEYSKVKDTAELAFSPVLLSIIPAALLIVTVLLLHQGRRRF